MAALETDSNVRTRKRARARAFPRHDAFAFTIDEFQALGGPGRSTIYKLFAEGKLKKINVAGRTKIEGDSGRALLRGEANTEITLPSHRRRAAEES